MQRDCVVKNIPNHRLALPERFVRLDHMPDLNDADGTRQSVGSPNSIGSVRTYQLNEGITFVDYFTHLRRRILLIFAWMGVCLGLSFLYLSYARIEYSATAQIALESRLRLPPGSDPSASALSPTLDSAQAESQVQVIKSISNLQYVFDSLNLETLFIGDPVTPNFAARMLGFLLPQQEETVEQIKSKDRLRREAAFNAFSNQVAVRRLGQSYILEITYRATTAEMASKVANSIAASYIRGQIIYRGFSDQRSSDFLQGRISSLQSQRASATEAVQSGIIPDVQFPDADARIVSPALLPLTKSSPQTRIILFVTIIFSVISSVGVILLLFSFKKIARSAMQVSTIFGIKCLAELSGMKSECKNLPVAFVLGEPNNHLSFAMRALRSSITNERLQESVIGFVSCEVTEARNFVISNLAFLSADASYDTLLIDADIQNPSLTRLLKSNNDLGLAEVLRSSASTFLTSTIKIADHLRFIPATANALPGDPNFFLGGSKFRNLVREVKCCHMTLINFPPLDSSLDLIGLSSDMDFVVLIVTKNRTSLSRLATAIDRCSDSRVNVLGFVFVV